LEAEIRAKEKSARDFEAKAADIDAAVFDLKAVNPNCRRQGGMSARWMRSSIPSKPEGKLFQRRWAD